MVILPHGRRDHGTGPGCTLPWCPMKRDLRCSARGCRAAATVDLQWRNPTLHDAARVKHWLACDEHADQFLADFLARARLPAVAASRSPSRDGCDPGAAEVPLSAGPLSRRWRTSCAAGWTKPAASMPCPACLPATAVRMICGELVVGRAGAQRPAQVGLGLREQAGAQLAVGGQPQPVAVAAERPGDRRDDADPARRASAHDARSGPSRTSNSSAGAWPRVPARRERRSRAAAGRASRRR